MATIHCINRGYGFIPYGDENHEIKKKLKLGKVYKMTVKEARNYQFHKLYFELLNVAWEFQPESKVAFFKNNFEVFRKSVELAAGHCDPVYNVTTNQWLEYPKSISFDSMDEIEFRELYNRVKDVLFMSFLTHITEEEFFISFINRVVTANIYTIEHPKTSAFSLCTLSP